MVQILLHVKDGIGKTTKTTRWRRSMRRMKVVVRQAPEVGRESTSPFLLDFSYSVSRFVDGKKRFSVAVASNKRYLRRVCSAGEKAEYEEEMNSVPRHGLQEPPPVGLLEPSHGRSLLPILREGPTGSWIHVNPA